jgi:hypothetical protein
MATAEDINAAAYLDMLPRLVDAHRGEYVLISNGDKVGCYPTEDAAFDDGYRKFGLDSFFVGVVSPVEQLAASRRFVSL